MIIKCIANSGIALSEKQIAIVHNSKDYEYNHLEIDSLYVVCGVSIFKDTLNYLIVGKYSNFIMWEPAELFEVVDNRIPPNWYYNYFGKEYLSDMENNPFYAIWGYKEITENLDHNHNLMERNPDDLKIFNKRKTEIENWHKENI